MSNEQTFNVSKPPTLSADINIVSGRTKGGEHSTKTVMEQSNISVQISINQVKVSSKVDKTVNLTYVAAERRTKSDWFSLEAINEAFTSESSTMI